MQKTGLKRNIIDKFYTKSCVVEDCIKLVKKYVKILKDDLIIEPSAGNGAFIENIKSLTNNYLFYDIEPENDNINKQDFLKIEINNIKNNYKNIHIIGNPPFGRQASLAIKFIKLCCQFASSISFILPKSFKKDSMRRHFSLNYHLITEIDLPNKAFLADDIEVDVPCIFQIWKYKDIPRDIIKKIEPINFKFVRKEETPDISFRRVGVNAGTIMTKVDDKSVQSHYFIKFKNNTIEDNVKKLEKVKFQFNNTVGPKSISKTELIAEFNKLLI